MKQKKLNYRFHNPNPDSLTANYILKVFLEADIQKVEDMIWQAAQTVSTEEETEEGTVALAM